MKKYLVLVSSFLSIGCAPLPAPKVSTPLSEDVLISLGVKLAEKCTDKLGSQDQNFCVCVAGAWVDNAKDASLKTVRDLKEHREMISPSKAQILSCRIYASVQ